MDLGLKGKVAMVSGASRGLGFAVAEALAREGAIVSMSSSNQASIDEARKRLSTGGAEVMGCAVDVRNAAQIASWTTHRSSRCTTCSASGTSPSCRCSSTPTCRRSQRPGAAMRWAWPSASSCESDPSGWLCRACARKRRVSEEESLPVVNSPRTGVCGYTGPTGSSVDDQQ